MEAVRIWAGEHHPELAPFLRPFSAHPELRHPSEASSALLLVTSGP